MVARIALLDCRVATRPERGSAPEARAEASPRLAGPAGALEVALSPDLVTESLLVLAPFKHDGEQFEVGDRLPTHHRWVRRAAREHADWFAMEYAAVPVDQDWLAELDREHEERYQLMLRNRERAKQEEEKAMRREMAAQDVSDPKLEKAFERQEEKRRKEQEQARADREREKLERRLALLGGRD